MYIEHDHKVDVHLNSQNDVRNDNEYWGTISTSSSSSLRRTRMLSMFRTRAVRAIVDKQYKRTSSLRLTQCQVSNLFYKIK